MQQCYEPCLCPVSVHNVWRGGGHGAVWLDRVSVTLGVQEAVHAVIIDAGSTGSRILAFTFFRSLAGKLIFHNVTFLAPNRD